MISHPFLCFLHKSPGMCDTRETWGAQRWVWGQMCWICHCGVDVSCMFQCFVWSWANVMSKGGMQPPAKAPGYRSLRRTAPLSQSRGSEWDGRYSLMHKCLLCALNGCGPWWISPADALSMRPALCIRASTQTQKGSLTSSVLQCIFKLKQFNVLRWVQASLKFSGQILGKKCNFSYRKVIKDKALMSDLSIFFFIIPNVFI